jgi:hypothetical protein
MMPLSKWRTAQAFFLAPFVVPFVLLLPFPGRDNVGHFSFTGLFAGFFVYLLYSLPIAYAAELLLGLPAWMLFEHYGVRSASAFAAVGALLGWLVFLAMDALSEGFAPESWTSRLNPLSNPFVPLCVIAGAASALVLRAVAFSGARTELSS